MFQYSTLKVSLLPNVKGLKVQFQNSAEKDHFPSFETLFELEGLCKWLAPHLEVNSVWLEIPEETQDDFTQFSRDHIKRYNKKLSDIIQQFLHLPQTVVFVAHGKQGKAASELSLGADLRLGDEKLELNFNYPELGLGMAAGGLGLLSRWVGHARARSWSLWGGKVQTPELLGSGLLSKTIQEREEVINVLKSINEQAPIARIQTKRALLENLLPHIEREFQNDFAFGLATLKSEDWKQEKSFLDARTLAKQLQAEQLLS